MQHQQDLCISVSRFESREDRCTSSISFTSTETPLSNSSASSLRSCLKASIRQGDEDPCYICTKKKSWRGMPVPNMKMIRANSMRKTFSVPSVEKSRSTSAGSTTSSESSMSGGGSTVAFDTVHIREYEQTLGDHPNVSYGPPIQLDWSYQELEPVQVDDYEDNRPQRRTFPQMALSYYTRKHLLMWKYKFNKQELKEATKKAGKIQFQRNLTKALLPVSKVEEALSSAGRKTKRMISPKKQDV